MKMPPWTLALPIVAIALVAPAPAWRPGAALALVCATAPSGVFLLLSVVP